MTTDFELSGQIGNFGVVGFKAGDAFCAQAQACAHIMGVYIQPKDGFSNHIVDDGFYFAILLLPQIMKTLIVKITILVIRI